MATGKASDMVIYNDQFYSGMTEVAMQNANGFNAASRGGIVLGTQAVLGQYGYESFVKEISSFESRQDTTSVSAATDLAATMDDEISVKRNRKIGPVGQTADAWRKIGRDPQHMSFILGQQAAAAKQLQYLNAAIKAGEGALTGQSAVKHDASDGTLATSDLATGLSKFGDSYNKIVCLVMHGKVYFDLIKNQITENISGVASMVVMEATPATFGLPVVISDDASLLKTATTPDTYVTLGLVDGGIRVEEDSEPDDLFFGQVSGLDSLIYRYQYEYAYNVGIKGFEWDVSNGGANPTDANLATSTNWDKVASDTKSLAGIHITSQ